ncbi:hypothetical protein F4778DRAFT_786497 [Xylariomycetidae sp. FL2044]|nr:hypothetical protein F4778DRAFT_786497 [Xylariomycetidae sp. FL2044]
MQLLLSLFTVSASLGLTHAACSTVDNVHVTFYGSPDNDPPGSDVTAYDCLGRGYQAGGTGTYEDPLTFASTAGHYSECEIIYSPYLEKYLILQDTCAGCSGSKPTDIWTGTVADGGDAQIECENALTPDDLQTVITRPDSNLHVDMSWGHALARAADVDDNA